MASFSSAIRTGMIAPLGVAVATGLLLGVTVLVVSPVLPSVMLFVLAMLLGIVLWARPSWLRPIGAALVGFGLCGCHVVWSLSLQLPVEQQRVDVVIVGAVVQLPEHELRHTRFLFRVDADAGQPEALRGRLLRLSWYDPWEGRSDMRHRIEPGSRWELPVRLRAPRGLRNPGWYDAEKHALANRLTATGYVREETLAAQLRAPRGVDALRDDLAMRIERSVAGPSSRFLRALAVGDTRDLGEADWEALRATGLTHLIAISGFHVGLVAGFFALLAVGIWKLLPSLGRHVPRPIAAAAMALAGAVLYSALAGFELPTVRTMLMIAAVVLARLLRRQMGVAQSLALAMIAILLVDPLSVLSAGFWLSFAGVAWLVWCMPDSRKEPMWRNFLMAQWVATLGLLPLTVILFGQASLAGPLANLVAIPWWSLVVIPLCLLGTALDMLGSGWGGWAWRLAAWCFDPSWRLFEWMAGSSLALWWLPESRWYALPLAVLGAVWMLLPHGVPGKWLAMLLWLPLLWPDRGLPGHGEVEVVVLDVGQGLAVVVRTANHTLQYDMGPAVPDGFDAGERVVVPALHALGVRRLDAGVVSHADSDHAGGLAAVMRGFPLPAVFAPEAARIPATSPCLAGSEWQLDGVGFRFLHPPMFFPDFRNEMSCVLRIETAHGSVLLPGDIGQVVERMLVREYADAIRSDVVALAHHGSRSSSDPMFVEASGAGLVIASAGHDNRFGHPHPAVVERWQASGAQVLSTATGGAVRIRVGAAGIGSEVERERHRRVWDAERRLNRVTGSTGK